MARHRRIKVSDIETALRTHRGNMTAAAAALGVTRQNIHNRVNANPKLRELVTELTEVRIDEAEAKLDDAIARGEAWAIALMLRTLGRHRGYVEKNEQQTSGELKIVVEYEDVAGGND